VIRDSKCAVTTAVGLGPVEPGIQVLGPSRDVRVTGTVRAAAAAGPPAAAGGALSRRRPQQAGRLPAPDLESELNSGRRP
jgi:hypothetical protein